MAVCYFNCPSQANGFVTKMIEPQPYDFSERPPIQDPWFLPVVPSILDRLHNETDSLIVFVVPCGTWLHLEAMPCLAQVQGFGPKGPARHRVLEGYHCSCPPVLGRSHCPRAQGQSFFLASVERKSVANQVHCAT